MDAMITNRSVRCALCALLLLAPLATLAAQKMDDDMMKDDGSFYITAAYSVALPDERDILDQGDQSKTVAVGTGFGSLGGQVGVGYAIAGLRPEISFGYRTASIDSLKLKTDGAGEDAEFASSGSVTSMDLAASVYYDIDPSPGGFAAYIGFGGGMSNVTLKVEQPVTSIEIDTTDDSVWALAFQAVAGISYAVTEDMSVTLGYRLTGTLESQFSKFDTSEEKMGMTLIRNVELGLRYSF